jgi:hypothetical protein
MKKIILILFVTSIVIACKKEDAPACEDCLAFYFEHPQPINFSELQGFPNRFKGLYISKDSTFIKIEEDRILREYFFKYRIHKRLCDSLKTEYNIVNNQLINRETKEKFDFYKKGDSLELVTNHIDTLFRFSYNQKAKRIKNQLVLSTRDSVLWRIEVLSLENKIIKFKNIYERKDLKKLDSVTATKGKMLDSTSYLIKPTPREFRNVLRIKHLGTDEDYKKISK